MSFIFFMDKNKTTIIITSNDGKPSRSISVSTKLIKNYRKYLVATVSTLAILFLLILSILFYSVSLKSDNHSLSVKVNTLKNQTDLLDSIRLKERLTKIDESLSAINDYLVKRNMLKFDAIGGDAGSEKNSVIPLVEFYGEQSDVFLEKVKQTPTGLPHDGRETSAYGYRTNPFGGHSGEFHPGIDFKGEMGEPVFSTATGIVERCDWYNGYGNAVVLRHSDEITVLYGHLSKINVVLGQKVNAGDVIGFIGSTGRSTGPHLHYEIRRINEDINPNQYLNLN